jgi:SAM-dependent methyltransferase
MAESFGVDAERYDRTRRPYPDELIQRIVAASPGRSFLDVGCGTGIEARQFREVGCTILGVEPDERMAEFARKTGIEVETAKFEDWGSAGRTFDGLVAATAWHWIDPVAGATKAAGVLRPGGLLAAFWHTFELPTSVAKAFGAALTRAMPDAPFKPQASQQGLAAYQGIFGKTEDGIREAGGFIEPERWRFDWEHTYSKEEWLDQLPTHGILTRLPPEKQAKVLDGVAEAIDEIGGSFTMPYNTVAVVATRTTVA